MSERARIRRGPLALAVLVVLALAAAGCDAGASPTNTQTGGTGCEQWCGSGSATVTLGGATTTISGGGCLDGGSAGVDIRFGDWQGVAGLSGYLMLIAYRAGGATPTPPATPANPPTVPTATGHPSPTVSGSVEGQPFILGPDTVVTFNANGTGSFSGTDVNGLGLVEGTFTCG